MSQPQRLPQAGSEMLRRRGYRVLEAASALDAQRLAEANSRIDLLLMNLSSFAPRDFQVALWFRAAFPETKILVMSDGLCDVDFKLGAPQQLAMLVKPFTHRELARAIRTVLGRSR